MVGLLVSGSWYHRFLAKVLELAVKSQYIDSGTFDERFLRITGVKYVRFAQKTL